MRLLPAARSFQYIHLFGHARARRLVGCGRVVGGIHRHSNAGRSQCNVSHHRHPPDDQLAQVDLTGRIGRRQSIHRHEPPALTAVRVAQRDLHPTSNFDHRVLVQHSDLGCVGRSELDRNVLRHHRRQPVELGGEHLRRLVGPGAPVVVSGTGVGQRSEEHLVVAVVETDRTRGDALVARRPEQTAQLIRVDDADVGVPIGEHDDSAQRVRAHITQQHLEPLQPTSTQIGRTPGRDRTHTSARIVEIVRDERKHHGGLVIEHHDAEAVVGAEQTQQVARGLADGVQRRTVHRTRAVEHDHCVDRRPLRRHRSRRLEFQHQVDDAVNIDGDQSPVKKHIRLHKSTPSVAVVEGMSSQQERCDQEVSRTTR